MTIEEMINRKKELGYTYEMISEYSGVPLGTVQKIFAGITKCPRYDTILALEQVLDKNKGAWDRYCEAKVPYDANQGDGKKQGEYTLKDYYELPREQRAELIDGVIYDMGAPSTIHQMIGSEIRDIIKRYVKSKDGKCVVFVSPVDVQLNMDDKTMIQPDVLVVCDRQKIVRRCVFGAPDFVVEILSKDTKKKDMFVKLYKYMDAGVREYWIVDPIGKRIVVYDFEMEECPMIYGFDSKIPIGIFGGECIIDFSEIYDEVAFIYEKEE